MSGTLLGYALWTEGYSESKLSQFESMCRNLQVLRRGLAENVCLEVCLPYVAQCTLMSWICCCETHVRESFRASWGWWLLVQCLRGTVRRNHVYCLSSNLFTEGTTAHYKYAEKKVRKSIARLLWMHNNNNNINNNNSEFCDIRNQARLGLVSTCIGEQIKYSQWSRHFQMILGNAWEYLSTCWKWGGWGANQRGHRSLSLESITHKWRRCFSIFFKTKCWNTDPSFPRMFPCFRLWNILCMEVQFSAQREKLSCRSVSWSLKKEQREGQFYFKQSAPQSLF